MGEITGHPASGAEVYGEDGLRLINKRTIGSLVDGLEESLRPRPSILFEELDKDCAIIPCIKPLVAFIAHMTDKTGCEKNSKTRSAVGCGLLGNQTAKLPVFASTHLFLDPFLKNA